MSIESNFFSHRFNVDIDLHDTPVAEITTELEVVKFYGIIQRLDSSLVVSSLTESAEQSYTFRVAHLGPEPSLNWFWG